MLFRRRVAAHDCMQQQNFLQILTHAEPVRDAGSQHAELQQLARQLIEHFVNVLAFLSLMFNIKASKY